MLSPTTDLFQRALGIEDPWRIISVKFSTDTLALNIYLDFHRGSRFDCPKCKSKKIPATIPKESVGVF